MSSRAILLVLLLAGFPLYGGPDRWKEAFKQGFASQNSWERRAAIGRVDVDDKQGVKLLLSLLAEEGLGRVDWYVRDAVIARLAEAKEPKALALVARGFKARQERVREGVVLALGRRQDPANLELLVDASRDSAPRVRRAALEALAALPDEPQAVSAILEAWKQAPEISRLGLLAARSLRWISNEDRGSRASYEAWWEEVADHWPTKAPPATDDDDEPLRTRVRGVELTFTERGRGTLPLLVIPNYATTPELYRPWLAALEDVYRVIYMELPKIDAFPPDALEEYAPGIPWYPVDLLVDAFDALRAERKVERFALFAHGYNSMLAMRYLTKHPDRVAHAILVSPISGGQAWSQILSALQRRGQATEDPELAHMARNMLVYPDGKRDYETSSDDEWQALRRKAVAHYLADGNDPALVRIFERGFYDDRDETSVTPDFELARQTKARVPILLQVGGRAHWSLERDAKRFRDHYPLVTAKTYPQSGSCPFVEDTAAWSDDVHEFFARHED